MLPKYREFAPLVNAPLNRESITGVTVLLGENEYDAGNILLQKAMNISDPTTIEHEISIISLAYTDLALEVLNGLNSGDINRLGYPQIHEDVTYSLWRDEEDYRIDWESSTDDIVHF